LRNDNAFTARLSDIQDPYVPESFAPCFRLVLIREFGNPDSYQGLSERIEGRFVDAKGVASRYRILGRFGHGIAGYIALTISFLISPWRWNSWARRTASRSETGQHHDRSTLPRANHRSRDRTTRCECWPIQHVLQPHTNSEVAWAGPAGSTRRPLPAPPCHPVWKYRVGRVTDVSPACKNTVMRHNGSYFSTDRAVMLRLGCMKVVNEVQLVAQTSLPEAEFPEMQLKCTQFSRNDHEWSQGRDSPPRQPREVQRSPRRTGPRDAVRFWKWSWDREL